MNATQQIKRMAAEYLSAPPLYLSYLPGRSRTLVLSFSGVGEIDEPVQRIESARLAGWEGENHVLFIVDSARSWMNAPGLVEALQDAVARLCDQIQPARIVAIGNSMGGSAALIWAGIAPCDAVFAIVPQYSVCDAVMRHGNNWRHYTDKITDWRFPAVPDLTAGAADVLILHGGRRLEQIHARRFRRGGRVRHYIVPGGGHQLAYRLKRRGALEPLLTHMINGDIPAACAAATAAGGLSWDDFATLPQPLQTNEA